MTEDSTPQTNRDRIVEEVVDKVEQRPSVEASRDEIRARAEESVDGLSGRPVQTFTPLLAENQVLGGLMHERSEEGRADEDGTAPS